MKRLLVFALFVCASVCGLRAQVVDTDVCSIIKNPKPFDGKIVRLKGIAFAGFDQFAIKDASACGYPVDSIWLDYPQGTKGKAGPVALLQVQPAHNYSGTYKAPTRAAVTLDKSKEFKQFDNLLSQTHQKGAGMCLGCMRYEVSATFVGRLDAVADSSIMKDKDGKITGFGGFGNMNAYPARLVLQSVSDVTPKEIDYSKSDEASKGDTPMLTGEAGLYDPVAAAQKSVAKLAGSPAGEAAQKDVAVYGKPGDKSSGVLILSGTANEAKDEGLGGKDSPDGILYNCTFNDGRLQGDAMLRALVHIGQHVNDLKNAAPGTEQAPLFILEYNGWMMAAATSMANGQKFLILPGGYVAWNATWTANDRDKNVEDALSGYLSNEARLSR